MFRPSRGGRLPEGGIPGGGTPHEGRPTPAGPDELGLVVRREFTLKSELALGLKGVSLEEEWMVGGGDDFASSLGVALGSERDLEEGSGGDEAGEDLRLGISLGGI